MGRISSKSSRRWMDEHVDDIYVKKAAVDGYRSRAVYKLIELDQKNKLMKPGSTILELGAAPGGWTQYLSEKAGQSATIIATDILPMDALPDVHFVQGDFTEQTTADEIANLMVNCAADLVLSDMAPNLSGVSVSDQARAMYLAELAFDAACSYLNSDGTFVTKIFQGEGSDSFIREVRKRFRTVKIRKPSASRPRSREVYVVARNLI